jgi:hypothetical protein
MSSGFSVDSLNANETRVIDIIERFCETLKPTGAGWGTKWNASEASTYLGFDIMGTLVFGCDFRTVQDDENRDLANSVLPASMLMYWVGPNDYMYPYHKTNIQDRYHTCLSPLWSGHSYVLVSSRRLAVNR